MYPLLFSYGIISIGGYGIMLGLAFYLGFLVGEREFKLSGKDPELAYKLFLAAIPSGIVGAKIFHILEHLSEFARDPMAMIFSGAGLSVYGGLVLALAVSIIIIKKNKENVLNIFDIATPTLALGYAVGRIGCHVAGDGCYGITTESFLGVAYPNGIVPTTAEVLPVPLFESLISFIVFFALLQLRKRELPAGMIFFIYLICNAVPRFALEFIRLNPKLILGLTQAQCIAICLLITAVIGIIRIRRGTPTAA
ncbi:MAG: prolipoprotein diacylglyceryl transferase [Spirochaetes bacterium]|nr:prolipoprotein diacylglyceryl transferase [Spirochaetota bacterium]